MRYFYITLLILSINAIQASILTNFKQKVLSIFNKARVDSDEVVPPSHQGSMRHYHHQRQEDAKDKKSAQNKATILKKVRSYEEDLNVGRDMPSSKLTETLDKKIGREYFHMDPVLNEIRRRRYPKLRRKNDKSAAEDDDLSSSSDQEQMNWKDEWDEVWLQKKFEALNSTQPRGDVVNMGAARPWGVPCGDPNQHDMPWATCMLPAECESEYRVYRGDYFCGRTAFICCALILTNYDTYQGLDVSFAGTSFSTDSNEKGANGVTRGKKAKDKKNEKDKRKKERDKRKRRIRKSIRSIVTEIRRILNRAFRNGTTERKRKTKELKKFIASLKKQYRKDRKSVVAVHDKEMIKIDDNLEKRLEQVRNVNQDFMSNATFRDIVVNGTVNKAKLLRLLRQHPELAKAFYARRMNTPLDDVIEDNLEVQEDKKDSREFLEYDVEYGMLYY